MNKETITIKIEYDKEEGRIMIGDLILAKIYACSDGLMISTIDKVSEKINKEHVKEHVQEISDDFDDEFGKLIGDQKLTYKIIDWWYNMIRRQMKYAEGIGREDAKKAIDGIIDEIKVIDMPIDFENEARKLPRESIFKAGQLNVIMRLEDLKKKLK